MDRPTKLPKRIQLISDILKPKKGTVLQKTIAKVEKLDENLEGSSLDILQNNKAGKLNTKEIVKIEAFADLVDDNETLTKRLYEKSKELKFDSVKDLALNYDAAKLGKLFHANQIPDTFPGETKKEKEAAYVKDLERKIFRLEPTASLQRVIREKKLKLADKNIEAGVTSFLNKYPEFNIKQDSILQTLADPEALAEVEEAYRGEVTSQLKTLQRLAAISPSPKSLEVLANKNVHSASQISQMSEGNFIKRYGDEMGSDEAKQVYHNAVAAKVRNEQALMIIRDAVRPSGIAMIDQSMDNTDFVAKKDGQDTVPLNYETLFGSTDFCECGHCNSVYSPSAYLVELFQYIRNNNLDPENVNMVVDPGNPGGPKIQKAGYVGTPLEHLFWRRPDLKCLELTCSNAFTILPYIDLSNEVMECYVAHNNNKASAQPPHEIQVEIETFNTAEDDESSTLLAQPQNIHKKAYCTLSEAVHPFCLPYHQPIDAIRIFVEHLKTSRYDLMKTYRPFADGQTLLGEDILLPPTANALAMTALEELRIDRALCSEYLLLTEEEHVIITKEGFGTKSWYETKNDTTWTDQEYLDEIGIKSLHDYYYHAADSRTLADLEKVKEVFLPQSGLSYLELVELLKTFYINPYQPLGEVKNIIDKLNLSYRYLQTFVNYNATDPSDKYGELINFIHKWHHQLQIYYAEHPDPCTGEYKDLECLNRCDIEKWVYYYFEKIGRMIVLESNEDFSFSYPGALYQVHSNIIYYITKEGTIVTKDGKKLGQIEFDNTVTWVVKPRSGQPYVLIVNGEKIGTILNTQSSGVTNWVFTISDKFKQKNSFELRDTCDISKIKLRHLDGSPLEDFEWDKIHRFIRLRKKLGWSMSELDQGILGLNSTIEAIEPNIDIEACIEEKPKDDDCACSKLGMPEYTIGVMNGNLICKIAKLLKVKDSLNIALPHLLCFWSDIETRGEKPLYHKLFLKKNLLALDPIFKADGNGTFLTDPANKISQHIPALMAGLNIKAEDISLLNEELLNDEMTLANVSRIYRHQLLARFLKIKISELLSAIDLFGDPFFSEEAACDFIECWHKMKDSGLKLKELLYVLLDQDDIAKPISLSRKDQLTLALDIFNGITKIDEDHLDVQALEYTVDVLRTKLALIYKADVVENIIALIEGTSIYVTNVPNGLGINVDPTITSKISYIDDGADSRIVIKGILTPTERTYYDSLSSDSEWQPAIIRINSQVQLFFEDTFYALIDDPTDRALLLTGDDSSSNTQVEKGMLLLSYYLPFLRTTLKDQLIVDLLTSEVSADIKDVDNLIRNVLIDDTSSISLLESFKAIGINSSPLPAGSFEGFLIPSKADDYNFVVQADTASTPGTIEFNGQILSVTPLSDPTNVFVSDTVTLSAGSVNEIKLSGFDAEFELLKWKTASRPSIKIPDKELIPNHLSTNLEINFKKLQKASMLVEAYNLGIDEVNFLQAHGSDFSNLDFNEITFDSWKRLHDYAWTRNSLPSSDYRIIDFFHWANYYSGSITEPEIIVELVKLTQWSEIDIQQYIQRAHFNILDRELLKNEIYLIKLIKANGLKEKVNVSVDTLFEWGEPRSDFDYTWTVFQDIQKVLRARYALDDWEEIIKPLNDKLRTNQRDALIDYLLNQEALKEWGVVDADSLYEFFLIDVQMESCMETSRIKQAISSTQLFVQRIFLNLEKDNIPNDEFDEQRKRWEWMSRYRIWEANRKVFLYPENWIRSELRDDKSPFYKELESELLQKDINPDMVKDALKTYLYKLDEVADMKVVGIHLEHEVINGSVYPVKLHLFSKTRNTPYFYYYRTYHLENSNWTPWEVIEIDIPTINYEGQTNDASSTYVNQIKASTGSYIIPVVWNKRLFIFFPQFLKKTKPYNHGTGTLEDIAGEPVKDILPDEFYEIKMAFSEYKNGVWSQKKISETSVTKGSGRSTWVYYENLAGYDFRTTILPDKVHIHFYHFGASTSSIDYDYFIFDGNQVYIEDNQANWHSHVGKSDTNDFHYSGDVIKYRSDPNYNYNNATKELNPTGLFKHDFSSDLIKLITISDLSTFFNYINEERTSNRNIDFGDYTDDLNQPIFHELKKAYSIYNWELFFYLPMAIAENLTKNQQFEEAMKWYHFVFHPFEKGSHGNRFWKFLAFRVTNAHSFLESFFNLLQPNQSNNAITEWRDNPFNPHLIARSRPSAYMKWTVMKYLDNILEWGDYLFRQDTIESVNYASQLYILAGHILGKRPQQIPKRGKIKPRSYLHVMDKLDAFSNATTEMELVFPYSNQVSIQGINNGEDVVLANLYGLSTTQYFCLPNNPKLMSYWDNFSDRLYKIRHCLNIDGVFRRLSLFEPPIDPALLVAATAQGLSLASVLNDLNTPVPNYRFSYMLQKAFELCNEVKSLGNTLLSTKEKKDGEVLSLIRARHEVSMNKLVMEIKKKQLEESQKSLDSLHENRKSPEYRMKYYLQQIGEDLSKVPGEDSDYSELADKVEAVLDESGLKLINLEKVELDKANEAADRQIAIGIAETLAGAMGVIPQIGGEVLPFGIGANVRFGGQHLGALASAIARGLQTKASNVSFQSSNAARKAGFTRQLQDRIQQANIAGREIKQIDKQIVTQKIRIAMAEQEINNHQAQIDNSKEVEEYLKTKYTNEQLYSWMEGQVKTLFYQSYKMAYDLAKKVEGLYRFERGLTSTNFIQFGYWNSARDGLLSGEQLYVGLKQIEMAHQETRAHDYEIPNKQISLRKLDPSALLNLRADGYCEFSIPEELYDLDFAGHYRRRIKSVSFSIPCIAGPYTNISAKATLTEHTFRISKLASGDYARKLIEDDERFMTVNAPINAIAMSSAQNDGGLFELNFRDERYMPFEGAGAISSWKLELPKEFRQFDYNTISDVIIHMSYTSCEGGEQLKGSANTNLTNVFSDAELYPHYALFDLKHDFAQEWYKAMLEADVTTGKYILKVDHLIDRLPYLTQGRIIEVSEIKNLNFENLTDESNSNPIVVSPIVGSSPTEIEISFDINNLQDRVWLIFKYYIK